MTARKLPPDWTDLPDQELLRLRLADLPLRIEGTVLEGRIKQLQAELEARELRFPVHFYISNEWFTPDGTVSMAVPFYLTHPRLERLEKAQMLEVEGGDHDWCMRILRHEAGHVIDNEYRLRLKRRRRSIFGSSTLPYPEFYDPRPYSKSFVQHLDPWYAQAHPDEDFAETFAVWLTPESDWRARYADWPALAKIEYMDELMRGLRGQEPLVTSTAEIDPLRSLRYSLAHHYRKRRRHHGLDHPEFYDRDLRRLFSDAPEYCEQHDRRAVPGENATARTPPGRELDGYLSVHDRPGAREHDTALQGAETPARSPRGTGAARVHRPADGADHELSAQRTTPGGDVMKKAM